MSAPAARTALFPVGPTTPLNFAPGSSERYTDEAISAAMKDIKAGRTKPWRKVRSDV